jgi:hypothetical protein
MATLTTCLSLLQDLGSNAHAHVFQLFFCHLSTGVVPCGVPLIRKKSNFYNDNYDDNVT